MRILRTPTGDCLKVELIQHLQLLDGFKPNKLYLRPGIGPGEAERTFRGSHPETIEERPVTLARELRQDFNRPLPPPDGTDGGWRSVGTDDSPITCIQPAIP